MNILGSGTSSKNWQYVHSGSLGLGGGGGVVLLLGGTI